MEENSPSDNRTAVKVKKYAPAPGRDAGDYDQLPAKEKYEASSTRNHIALLLLYSALPSMGLAGAYSLYKEDFGPLVAVWSVLGPLIGSIIGYYFGSRKE